MASPTSSSASPQSAPVSSNTLSVLSLLIFIHLTCVFVVLGSNLQRSPLQSRLVSLFAVYTQFFDFDPDFTPYYFVSGRELAGLSIDDDAILVIDLYADPFEPIADQKLLKTVTLPDQGSRWLGDKKRYISLSKAVVLNAALEADDITGEIAKIVGRRIMNENSAKRAVFRAIRRDSQPMDLEEVRLDGFPADPTDARYDFVQYEADVWFDDDGTVEVVKRAARGEVAPRQNGS